MVQARIKEITPVDKDKVYLIEIREVRNIFYCFWYWLSGKDKWEGAKIEEGKKITNLSDALEELKKIRTFYNPKYYM